MLGIYSLVSSGVTVPSRPPRDEERSGPELRVRVSGALPQGGAETEGAPRTMS